MLLRSYRSADCEEIAKPFYDTVHEVKYYRPKEKFPFGRFFVPIMKEKVRAADVVRTFFMCEIYFDSADFAFFFFFAVLIENISTRMMMTTPAAVTAMRKMFSVL